MAERDRHRPEHSRPDPVVTGRGPRADPRWASTEERLRRLGCVAADDEADELLADHPSPAALNARLARRAEGEPLAWIVGATTFDGIRVQVDAGLYVPRWQSEALVRRAAATVVHGGRVADLCTGSGAVAAALARRRPDLAVVAADIDPAAVRCARRNGVAAVVADLGAGLRSGVWDAVVAVVPYVPTEAMALLPPDVVRHEPRRALDGGHDGLAVARRLVLDARRLLRPGGRLLLECGGDQDLALHGAMGAAGFVAVERWTDEDGDLRGVAAVRSDA